MFQEDWYKIEGGSMKYNFTDRVRLSLARAREEAVRFRHDYVGTEHMLLGLLDAGGVGNEVLDRLGVDPEEVRKRVAAAVRRGSAGPALGELPYTSRAKKVLELAMAAARELDQAHVGTEHILLGLLREEKGIAANVLRTLGVTPEAARSLTLELRGVAGAEPPRGRFRVRIDDTSSESIYEQIVSRVREGVATGALTPGERLPPVRRLADELDIAPGTVARAYTELERLGVVVTEGARGTRVAEPGRSDASRSERREALEGLLRPVAVAAFHMGATAAELRRALEAAMEGIMGEEGGTA